MQGVEVWNAWRKEHPYEQPDLSVANLSSTNLSSINLIGTNLSIANLRYANLSGANLSRADLYRTNLSNIATGYTIFGSIDLQTVKGLKTITHHGPSTIGTDTILLSESVRRGSYPPSDRKRIKLSEWQFSRKAATQE
jgi:hypothetical protein